MKSPISCQTTNGQGEKMTRDQAQAEVSLIKPIYKRIILKITGEAFAGGERPINMHSTKKLSDEIEAIHKLGVQMGIVVGGGNIARGRDLLSIDRAPADYIGMSATVANALFLQATLEKRGISARTQTAIEMKEFAEPFIYRRAIRHMEKNRIVILACGTGHPFCSTDYTAMLRAYELNADALLKGTKVNGLYTDDPQKKKSAKFISEISYQDALKSNVKDIMDNAAFGLALDNPKKIPLHIFNIFEKGNLLRVLLGEKIGSKIF